MEIYTNINKKYHCVKNAHIRIFFWSVSSRIRTKNTEQKKAVFGNFSHSVQMGKSERN